MMKQRSVLNIICISDNYSILWNDNFPLIFKVLLSTKMQSTLDCFVCSDSYAATNLVSESYLSLRPGGAYVIVSFNHADFIVPLVRDCPGLDWDPNVEQLTVGRHVHDPRDESLWDVATLEEYSEKRRKNDEDNNHDDGESRGWVNVFIFRRRCHRKTRDMSTTGEGPRQVDGFLRDSIREHIHRTNDEWFRNLNPMMTGVREMDLKKAFMTQRVQLNCDEEDCEGLPLKDCYNVLFTEAEKEHLDYDFFLEDWAAFREKENHCDDKKISQDRMTIDIALKFLEEMQ
uniref:Uncharacterized protein n=1 Tax=Corethron hystrix TaxID=216773 RepID=A0A7S1BLB4_9STRA|mmetsp:Transcript_32986/g.75987  ORF Transcript_32986/g.75987 Transcript_32986/m.75987 type:complete len:287 (+) Transcript_32986:495-1355(+)